MHVNKIMLKSNNTSDATKIFIQYISIQTMCIWAIISYRDAKSSIDVDR